MDTYVRARARVVTFLTTRRAGLEMLLDLDDLGLLEDVHGASETLERLVHLLGLDDLGLLEDVHAAGEALQRLGDLISLDWWEHRVQFSSDTLLGR